MLLIEIFLLGIALSIDACVVSFSQGLIVKKDRTKNAISLALSVGLFQGIMPVIGWYLCYTIDDYIRDYASWLAFSIFMILGLKFIYDAFQEDGCNCDCDCKGIFLTCLVFLGIATSIDAFIAGASIYFLDTQIWLPALVITILTFVNSIIGFVSGDLCKNLPTKWLEIIAGLILILIGIKSVLV